MHELHYREILPDYAVYNYRDKLIMSTSLYIRPQIRRTLIAETESEWIIRSYQYRGPWLPNSSIIIKESYIVDIKRYPKDVYRIEYAFK